MVIKICAFNFRYVLEEHLDWGTRGGGIRRTLADDEELYTVQV